ncbi:MAG: hypothetical protein WDM80_09130 [Limisphaerales bacterium]
MCIELAKEHYLSINSNLSNPSILDFAERVNPERVHYVNAALHSDERQKKSFARHLHQACPETPEASFQRPRLDGDESSDDQRISRTVGAISGGGRASSSESDAREISGKQIS